ncbi:PIN domain-containing protein [Picosynechococcus sp. PCC 73109]|uniref:PIN domain-containing protein n=1 Tax=Picosynechococcus sp. PCC 73109 TaxID=374982 RepID=UPI00074592BB|nr:PIN domain-containing protein [Picosynechococcus sp. PCC 73109]AMA10682.1 DNA-binding protein [Picosynechococcus sp. PCC 73109]
MSDRVFLDTNILIYIYSQDEPQKQQRAIARTQAPLIWISTQVLNETINVLRRKFKLDYNQIIDVVTELTQQFQVATVSTETINQALGIAQRYQFSYCDSLIVASALESRCSQLFSEDLHNNQRIYDQLTIVNPFV